MSELLEKCTLAKDAGYKMVSVSTVTKDNALEAIANALVERADEIIAANNIDIENVGTSPRGRNTRGHHVCFN